VYEETIDRTDSRVHRRLCHSVHGHDGVEAGMKWTDDYISTEMRYRWHDLMDGDGEDTDGLLGYVREDIIDHTFVSVINAHGGPSKKFDNLKDAKAHIITYYVLQKLEGA
jgi:hypothetical protein